MSLLKKASLGLLVAGVIALPASAMANKVHNGYMKHTTCVKWSTKCYDKHYKKHVYHCFKCKRFTSNGKVKTVKTCSLDKMHYLHFKGYKCVFYGDKYGKHYHKVYGKQCVKYCVKWVKH